jgi:nucleotide-binding universal stress UspA family protein
MKILVPTDFSDNANHALALAKRICFYEKGSITLIFAFYAVYDFASQAELIVDNIEQDAKKILEEAVEQGISDGINIDYTIRQGTVSSVVTSTAFREEYDLIVMGTQGAGNFSKKYFGTNTGHVIKESQVPVLAIPENFDFSNLQKITISSELKEEDEVYFRKLIQLTHQWNLPYEILHIEKEYDPQLEEKALSSQKIFTQHYSDLNVTFKKISSKNINDGLSTYLSSNPAALLVMFYKKKTFFEHLFNKSYTVAQAYHLMNPLLIIY